MKKGVRNAVLTIAALVATWTTAAMAGAQQPNLPGRASLVFNGIDGPPWPITGVLLPTGTVSYVNLNGLPASPFVVGVSAGILAGQPALGGFFDLDPVGFGVAFDGFSNPMFQLSTVGTLDAWFWVVQGTPVGFQRAFQAAVADWLSPWGITLTAATLVIVSPGVTFTNLVLANNNAVFFNLLPFGITFPFYNATYNGFWVNSNGSITFGAGDPSPVAGTAAFVAGPPRIAGFWCDLDPSVGGTVSVTVDQSSAPATVRCTFQGVPEPGLPTTHSLVMTMFAAPVGDVLIAEDIFNLFAATTILTGIGPGGGLGPQPPVNFTFVTPAFPQIIGAPLASLHQVFLPPVGPGPFPVPLPPPGWNLTGRTLTFQAVAPGTAAASYVVF